MKMKILTHICTALRAIITRTVIIECDAIPYKFKNVPFKKIINWIKIELSVYFKPEKPWGYPTHLQIEPSALCNLRCARCYLTAGMTRPQGYMDIALYRKLLDEIGEYVFLILLWDWGEPFLNKECFEMVSYARTKGIKVVTSTNGHVLAEEGFADKLIDSGLEALIVAVDGISPDTYQTYRKGGDLSRVVKGIQTLTERKRTRGASSPFVNFRFLVTHHNEHEVKALSSFARQLGVDALTLKTINPNADDLYSNEKSTVDKDGSEFFPRQERYRRFRYTPDGTSRIRVKNNPCKSLWNNPVIHWNGTVCPCTYDYNDMFVFGTIREQSFIQIWTGPRYQRMRREFKTDWERIKICCNCSLAFEGGNCPFEAIVEAHFFTAVRYC